MGQKLEEAGYPDMSSAVRPMAITPNERRAFLQVSFFHGFVTTTSSARRSIKVVDLPNLIPNVPREQYLLDSAHHGIAISGDGRKLCVAGTMSDYVAIVNRRSLKRETPSTSCSSSARSPTGRRRRATASGAWSRGRAPTRSR